MTVYFHVVSSTFHHNIYALRLRYHPWISPHKTSIFGLTPLISGSRAWCCCSRQRAHTLRTPKHRSHYRTMDGGVADTTRYIIHRRLRIGKMWEKRTRPVLASARALDRCTSTSPGGRRGGRGRGGRGSGGMCYATGECRSCSPATEYLNMAMTRRVSQRFVHSHGVRADVPAACDKIDEAHSQLGMKKLGQRTRQTRRLGVSAKARAAPGKHRCIAHISRDARVATRHGLGTFGFAPHRTPWRAAFSDASASTSTSSSTTTASAHAHGVTCQTRPKSRPPSRYRRARRPRTRQTCACRPPP